MNKKGFTLMEIIVVIILMGILFTFVAISVSKIRENSMNNLYNNKIIYIETGAKEWGNDNLNALSAECNYVTVEDLITGGYITGDSEDKVDLINPNDNSSFNEKCVCVKYENIFSSIPGDEVSTTRFQVTSSFTNDECGGI